MFNTNTLTLNHTCLRVKDPKVSVEFYTKNFGLKLIDTIKFPDLKFDLYFLSFNDSDCAFNPSGVLELTHNYGTEDDDSFRVNNGNDEPFRGFGHICFSVDNIVKASEALEANGVSFKKRLTDGRQKDIAFALDPDGYWVELIENRMNFSETESNFVNSKFNHTMIRVKDPVKSLKFYREVLGFKLLNTVEFKNANFNLYFLGYNHDPEFVENSMTLSEQSKLEGVLELTWNYGTENDESFKYHNGNDVPQGYGHIGVSIDNPLEWTNHLEEKFGDELNWSLKFNHGKLKNIAFIRDPDHYSIEILPKDFKP